MTYRRQKYGDCYPLAIHVLLKPHPCQAETWIQVIKSVEQTQVQIMVDLLVPTTQSITKFFLPFNVGPCFVTRQVSAIMLSLQPCKKADVWFAKLSVVPSLGARFNLLPRMGDGALRSLYREKRLYDSDVIQSHITLCILGWENVYFLFHTGFHF